MNTAADSIPDTELSKLKRYRESSRLPYESIDCGDLIDIAERELLDSPYVTRLLEKALKMGPYCLSMFEIWHLLQKLDRSKLVDCLKVLVYLATAGNTYWWTDVNRWLSEVVDPNKPQEWQRCAEFALEDDDDDTLATTTWGEAIYLSQQFFPSFAQTLVQRALSSHREEVREVGREFQRDAQADA